MVLRSAVNSIFPSWTNEFPRLAIPPDINFGDLSSSIAYEIARQLEMRPEDVARKIAEAVRPAGMRFLSSVEDRSGYVNFRLNYETASGPILETAIKEDTNYGIEKVAKPRRVAVEHTSANPSGPLTMGHARNAILGDALARLLKARGHDITRRFYVDDVGRQVSILAYGYELLHRPIPQGKPDSWLGRLYACTNCALQVEVAKRRLKQLKESQQDSETLFQIQRELDEWVGIAAELEATDRQLLTDVSAAIQREPDPEKAVQELGLNYERQDPAAVSLVRKVAELSLDGIRSTLERMGIMFDEWDWESELVWDGRVAAVVQRLRALPFARTEAGSLSLDVNAIVEAYSLRDLFKLSPSYEVPSLTLVRSDGTTLYPTRDIAYTLAKFADSDRVINVIATEQTLPQLQMRLALYALGEREAALNLIHYAYGLVELPGVKMSKRRARYVALDDVVEQAKRRVEETIAARKQEFEEEELNDVIHKIALGAVKFAMLNVSSVKNMTFTWDRVLSLERNSAPFINYAYTRAGSILRKLGSVPTDADATALTHPLEYLLIAKIGQLPDVFCEAADELKPEELTSYANSVAEKFHEYYEKVDVIHTEERVKNARALLVRAIQIVLRNSMSLLGIELSERM